MDELGRSQREMQKASEEANRGAQRSPAEDMEEDAPSQGEEK